MNTGIAARLAAVVLLGIGALVACSNDQQACAATGPKPPPAPKPYRPAGGQRTTSKIQDKPRTTTGRSNNPYWKSSSRPTTWDGYNSGSRNWSQPYRKNMPIPQQPVIIHVHNYEYRTYPGYSGYYPVGIWPIGYGQRYGCVADREADPVSVPPSTPAPTVTVTVTPSASPTVSPTASPTGTPR